MIDGLVIGKFYPPHAGHHYLIDQAAEQCEYLRVLVLAHPDESISLALRTKWLQMRHPNVTVIGKMDDLPVDYDSDEVWDQQIALMMEQPFIWPDVVFGSEPYVPELARRLNEACKQRGLLSAIKTKPDIEGVIIDQSRTAMPVSGTKVRANPPAYWWALTPPVRAYLAKRVVVMGAESTGTTTLTRALARHYNTVWVPEYGRYFSEGVGKDYQWASEDFELIAREQQRQEDELALRTGPILFGDTDALATTVWHERYMRYASPEVERIAQQRRPDAYLVTSAKGIPWEDDGTRDGEAERGWMSERFWDVAWTHGNMGAYWLEGTPQQRLKDAIVHCDALISQGWHFNDPPG